MKTKKRSSPEIEVFFLPKLGEELGLFGLTIQRSNLDGGHLNLDGGTLNLDGGTLTLDGRRVPLCPPYNLSTAYTYMSKNFCPQY